MAELDGFNLLCGDFFISTGFASRLRPGSQTVSISFAEIFLFPPGGRSGSGLPGLGFNLLCGDFFISTWSELSTPCTTGGSSFNLLCGDFLFPPGNNKQGWSRPAWFQSPLRRFFYFHFQGVESQAMGMSLVSISFAEIFLFPPQSGKHPPSKWAQFQSPLRRFFYFHPKRREGEPMKVNLGFNLLCGDFFISTLQSSWSTMWRSVSISFAEIFLFPLGHCSASYRATGGVSISFAEIFLFPPPQSAYDCPGYCVFQSPLRRFFYFH